MYNNWDLNVAHIFFAKPTQAISEGESRKTDILPGLPLYGHATTWYHFY